MKAITLSQPFASLISDGEKFVENRSWPTSHRGQLAIHAGKGTQYLSRSEVSRSAQGVIAICNLAACLPLSTILANVERWPERVACGVYTWRQLRDHDHTEGPYCLILANIRKVGPYKCSGKQGLWGWDEQCHNSAT